MKEKIIVIGEVMKKLIKYPIIFIITIIICLLLLVITALIPKSSIENSIKESSDFMKTKYGIQTIKKHQEYTYLFYYSDSILLNTIYCLDTSKPLQAVLEAKYYDKEHRDITTDFVKLVEENKEPNSEYLRYWYGPMIIIRPLLVFFNIQQIYIINAIIMFALIIWLMIILIKKSKLLALAFLIGIVMIAIQFVPLCLIYTWTILLMLIVSIILLKIEEEKPNWIYPIFFICGILTAYFDLLSTEILTVLVPLIILITLQYKEGKLNSLKEGFKLTILSIIAWGIGYVGMFISKWIIASIVLNINAMDFVKEKAMVRIGLDYYGEATTKIRWQVFVENLSCLYPIANYELIANKILLGILIAFILLELVIVDPKKIKKMWISLLMIIIGFIIPLIRFEVLLNHSYNHSFMTFRILLATVMAFIIIIYNSFEARREWVNKVASKFNKKAIKQQ